ncbi:hypothetical protein HB364_27220 [Pseudoflavitalea sp. X16]|uniref:hypothetical protein n=1 Tax=Paraflavitalea devenefica TaxID=2716334 RepID=UPI0014229BD0|nr:hypothetical protein [Paraflavitalea devenefica]NII28803.1 hypothetical protein [Paraflavitalea devenefica]
MKLLRITVLSLLCASTFMACKKDKDDATTTPKSSEMAGNWVGKYGNGSDSPALYFAFVLGSSGTIEEVNKYGVKLAKGTWTINGYKFVASLRYLADASNGYSVTATLNEAKNTLTGTWGYRYNVSNGGAFYMNK